MLRRPAPLACAERGLWSAQAPENSVPALEAAIAEGCELAAFDLRRSRAANGDARRKLGGNAPVRGRCLDDLPGVELPDRLRNEAGTAFLTGRPYSSIYTSQRPDGGLVLIQWDIWPLHRQNGRITHWMDRRRRTFAASGRQDSDIRWLQLAADALRATDVGVWHWDLRSGHITFSPRLLRQLGYDPAEAEGSETFLAGLHHPDDLPKMRAAIDEAIAGSGHFAHVVRLMDRKGRYHWIAVQGQVIIDGDGTPVRILGTESDVTEETLLRDRLLRAERIAKIGNWSLKLDPPGMYWSPECYRIHGLDPARFTPTLAQIGYLVHPEDKALLQDALRRTLKDGKMNCGDHDRFRARIIRGDGEIRHCEWNTLLERDKAGKPAGLTGTVQDITDAVDTEKRLVQAQKMEVVGQMAGGVAHDFNNLLAVIVGNLELLEETSQLPGGADLIRSAIDAAKKGAGLTRNLLSFARKATLEPTRIEMGELVGELNGMLRRVLPSTIEVELRCGADTWPVHADRNSFENALLNLAINARDAMDGIGKLTIETLNVALDDPFLEEGQEDLAPGPYAVVAVTDTGIGMSKAQLAKVFTPFYSTKPPSKGSGLGLPMVQGFAKQSGGGVRVYSEPGIGTTVKIFLPASDADAARVRRARAAAETEVRLSGRVLLVEDDPGVARVLSLRPNVQRVARRDTGDGPPVGTARQPVGIIRRRGRLRRPADRDRQRVARSLAAPRGTAHQVDADAVVAINGQHAAEPVARRRADMDCCRIAAAHQVEIGGGVVGLELDGHDLSRPCAEQVVGHVFAADPVADRGPGRPGSKGDTFFGDRLGRRGRRGQAQATEEDEAGDAHGAIRSVGKRSAARCRAARRTLFPDRLAFRPGHRRNRSLRSDITPQGRPVHMMIFSCDRMSAAAGSPPTPFLRINRKQLPGRGDNSPRKIARKAVPATLR